MPKSDRQKAVAYADKWMSQYIRLRDKHCYICGSRENLQNGHLITRAKYATRWAEINCKAQCSECNKLHEYQPERFTSLWISEHGESAYHELVRMSNKSLLLNTAQIRAIGEEYRKKYNNLTKNEFFQI
jgi:hypothetical protein